MFVKFEMKQMTWELLNIKKVVHIFKSSEDVTNLKKGHYILNLRFRW